MFARCHLCVSILRGCLQGVISVFLFYMDVCKVSFVFLFYMDVCKVSSLCFYFTWMFARCHLCVSILRGCLQCVISVFLFYMDGCKVSSLCFYFTWMVARCHLCVSISYHFLYFFDFFRMFQLSSFC